MNSSGQFLPFEQLPTGFFSPNETQQRVMALQAIQGSVDITDTLARNQKIDVYNTDSLKLELKDELQMIHR